MRSRAFIVGFGCGLFPFIVANIYSYHRLSQWIYSPTCNDCGGAFGFPAEMFAYTGFFSHWSVLWGGLAANLGIALFAALALGLICRRAFGKHGFP
jgi:hypothetical protein